MPVCRRVMVFPGMWIVAVNTGPLVSLSSRTANKPLAVENTKNRESRRDTSSPTWADVGLENVYREPSAKLFQR